MSRLPRIAAWLILLAPALLEAQAASPSPAPPSIPLPPSLQRQAIAVTVGYAVELWEKEGVQKCVEELKAFKEFLGQRPSPLAQWTLQKINDILLRKEGGSEAEAKEALGKLEGSLVGSLVNRKAMGERYSDMAAIWDQGKNLDQLKELVGGEGNALSIHPSDLAKWAVKRVDAIWKLLEASDGDGAARSLRELSATLASAH